MNLHEIDSHMNEEIEGNMFNLGVTHAYARGSSVDGQWKHKTDEGLEEYISELSPPENKQSLFNLGESVFR